MAPEQAPEFDIEEDDTVMSDSGEDLDYDSSSDYIPPGDEPTEDSDSAPSRRRHRRRRRNKFIYPEAREAKHTYLLGKRYPDLSKLRIPAGRRKVIWAAEVERSKERKMAAKGWKIRNETMDPEPDSSPSKASASYQPTKCFLNLLPTEVQLQILGYCLTTDAPFIDFCFGYRFAASEISTMKRPGQKNVSLAVLATNHHLRSVGLHVLWQENRFLYTRSDEFTLLNTDTLMKLPQVSLLRHLTIHQDCMWQSQTFYNCTMLNAVLFAVSVTERLPVLHSLQIDFVTTEEPPYYSEARKRLVDAVLETQYFFRDRRRGRSLRALPNVSVTGVSDDDVGCLAVKILSCLLGPEGVLSVGLAGRGESSRGWCVVVPEEFNTVTMTLKTIDAWVTWQREEHSRQRKLITSYGRTSLPWIQVDEDFQLLRDRYPLRR